MTSEMSPRRAKLEQRLPASVGGLGDPFRLLVDNQLDIICIYEPDGRIFYANLAYASFFGTTPEELKQACIVDLAPEHAREHARENLARSVAAFAEDETMSVNEFELRNAEGELRWVEFTDQPVFDKDGELFMIISAGRDVSSRRDAEQKLVEMNQRLAESNRDLEDFAYVASHDLQEPLRKIIAFSNRLTDKASDELSEKNLDYLERISGAAGRMQGLIEDLLEVSRVATRGEALVPVDLKVVLDGVLSDLEIAIERSGATVAVPDDLPKVLADPSQMRQLFQNLIGNALKFQDEGITPVVNIAAATVNDADVPTAIKSSTRTFVKISVADNGIGFEEKDATKIFAIFHRLHGRSEYEGTGIGLSVCKKIADRHHGDISAHSEPGSGATFEVLLPTA